MTHPVTLHELEEAQDLDMEMANRRQVPSGSRIPGSLQVWEPDVMGDFSEAGQTHGTSSLQTQLKEEWVYF